MTNLGPGDSGPEVQQLQEWLYALGYELYGTADYDEHTETAVRRFQSAHNMKESGIADDGTHALIQGEYFDTWPDQAAAEAAMDAGVPPPDEPELEVEFQWGPVRIVNERDENVAEGEIISTVFRAGDIERLVPERAAMIEAALAVSGFWPFREMATSMGWTVGVGIHGDIAVLVGANVGTGIYFGPNDEIGLYLSLGADIGAVLGVSAQECFTVVFGEPHLLAGECLAVGIGAGEGFVAGGALLFPFDAPTGSAIGVAAELGVGFGVPTSTYLRWTSTRIDRL